MKESTKQNEERPDYLWSDKHWERKGIHSVKDNTIDLRIRKGYSQIEGRRGGLVLDFSSNKLDMASIERSVKESLIRRAKGTADIFLIKNGEYKILRATKK